MGISKRVFLKYAVKAFVFVFISIRLYGSNSQGAVQKGDFYFTENLEIAYKEVCKLKIDNAKKYLSKESTKNGIRILIEDYIDFIYLLNNGSKSDYERLQGNEKIRLNALDDLDKNSPYKRFIEAEIKLHWAINKYRFGDEFKAARGFMQAYSLLNENSKLYPNFLPHNKSLGAINIILSLVPQNYTWVLNILGFKGDIQKGKEQLYAATKQNIFSEEAQFYIFIIDAYLFGVNNDKKENLRRYIISHKDYLSIYILGILSFTRNNQNEQADELIDRKPATSEYLQIPIFDFYQGEIALQKGNYNEAAQYYLSYSKKNKGVLFQKECLLKLFYCYWLSNKKELALTYFNKIKDTGSRVAESDKNAQYFYYAYNVKKDFPDALLVKAKFFFDGGYYEKAKKEIDTINEDSILNIKEKTEFYYRKGKIYQETMDYNKAIALYSKSIKLSEHQEWGYKGISAFQIGEVYSLKDDKQKAKSYYEKAISYSKLEKRNTVYVRANLAIQEL